MDTVENLSLSALLELIIKQIDEISDFPKRHKDYKLLLELKKLIPKETNLNSHEINIYELGEALNVTEDKETLRREAKRVIEQLKSRLTKHRPAIETRLHKSSVREFVELQKVDSRSILVIKKTPSKSRQASIASESTPELIQYEPQIEKSLFGKLEFEVNYTFLIISTLMIPLLFGGTHFIWRTIWLSDFPSLLIISLTIAICYGIYRVLCPFIEVLNNGIALAPFWLKPTLYKDVFILFEKSNGKSRVKFNLKSYKATCPICGSKINIQKGKALLKGRLVGKCELTNEHLYTFDHVKERGVPANTPMYIPKD